MRLHRLSIVPPEPLCPRWTVTAVWKGGEQSHGLSYVVADEEQAQALGVSIRAAKPESLEDLSKLHDRVLMPLSLLYWPDYRKGLDLTNRTR